MSKPTLAIIGSGWSGYTLSQKVSPALYNIVVISPIRTIQYTPLLASAAAGLFNFRLAEEPIRRKTRNSVKYYKAIATSINLDRRTLACETVGGIHNNDSDAGQLESSKEKQGDKIATTIKEHFEVSYDELCFAPGCSIQTFGTPGALENALFLKTTDDARKIQQRLLEILDMASLPTMTEQAQRDLLSIRIVGGGAIGIEAAAELYDLWHEDMRHLYAHLDGKVTITIHDVAPKLLGTFDQSLSEYAMESMKEKSIEMKTSSHIERVEPDAIFTKEDGRLPFGMLIWATGNAANPLVEQLPVKKPENGLPRVLTDHRLRMLRPDGSPIEGAYALGDAADVEGESLPTLAEVALQKSEYLVQMLNRKGKAREANAGAMVRNEDVVPPFQYKQRALLAYLGQRDGIIGGREDWTGNSAWLAWRSGSLGWTRSWRRKIMIVISWVFIWIDGRDIARR
ncbi:MAG: hypothetical protein M1820_007557 [Bogoriella megaspora]|nr:MAG: hypothetical protein M1820_007557 [Bogoriella megaspora]